MTLRVWLHEGHDGDPGVVAWGLDFLGFSTWAPSEEAVLAQVPAKFGEYAAWRARHGTPAHEAGSGVEVVDRFAGDEILFPPDLESSTPAEIALALRLLDHARQDLVAALESAPEGVLDRDPPYERFASWADWRTVRANLVHVANAETHYYTRVLGHESPHAPATGADDWRELLRRTRAETSGFLLTLAASDDLARVGTVDFGRGPEAWSVRKALRRLVGHERLHGKSIRRILRFYGARGEAVNPEGRSR